MAKQPKIDYDDLHDRQQRLLDQLADARYATTAARRLERFEQALLDYETLQAEFAQAAPRAKRNLYWAHLQLADEFSGLGCAFLTAGDLDQTVRCFALHTTEVDAITSPSDHDYATGEPSALAQPGAEPLRAALRVPSRRCQLTGSRPA